MNDNVKHFVIKYKWIIKIVNFLFNLKNKKKYWQIVNERKQTSLFDYKSLSKPIPYSPTEYVIDNNIYGIGYWLKRYSGINKSLDGYIEHGVFFGSLVRKDQKEWFVNSVITYSKQREFHLKNSRISKDIKVVGPFIHYVDELLDTENFNELKKSLGKVLLVFPFHSLRNADFDYNVNEFIDQIESVKKEFDTVLVSLYYTDVFKGEYVEVYQKQGYKIVTSGHRFDINFLARQKTIIKLSDFTMSNSVGTHIGYCNYLNKPHYVFMQEAKMNAKSKKDEKQINNVRTVAELEDERLEKSDVVRHFNKFQWQITEEQRNVVDKYWGTNNLMDPKELREYIK